MNQLKNHARTKHQKSLCELCLKHKSMFLNEITWFTKAGLTEHEKKGNPSQGFEGHPECDFCHKRFAHGCLCCVVFVCLLARALKD